MASRRLPWSGKESVFNRCSHLSGSPVRISSLGQARSPRCHIRRHNVDKDESRAGHAAIGCRSYRTGQSNILHSWGKTENFPRLGFHIGGIRRPSSRKWYCSPSSLLPLLHFNCLILCHFCQHRKKFITKRVSQYRRTNRVIKGWAISSEQPRKL